MYALILFVLFPILYSKNRSWYFVYALLFFVFGRFIAYKAGLYYSPIIHNVFSLGVLVPFALDKSYHKYFKVAFLWVIVFALYLLLLHVIHGNDFLRDLKDNNRGLFLFIFAVEVYENIRNNKLDLSFCVKVFKYILIFEIVLCWMQYISHDFGNFFRITEYKWRGEVMSLSGNSEEIIENNLTYGTLMGASTFANYLSVCIIVYFLAMSKRGFSIKDYIFLGICVLTLLITGIRAPFLVMLFMLYFILMRNKKTVTKVLYIFVGVAAFFLLLPLLSSIGSAGGLHSLDSTVMRSLNVFTQIQTGSVVSEGTFTWPLSMLPYIAEHPLLGNGLHYRGGYFMALNLHVLEDLSISDAGIFFYWAEYGLIGLAVFFFFYFYLIRISSNYGINKSDIRFLVILLFFQSIVDTSVVDNYCITVFAFAPIVLRYYQLLDYKTKAQKHIHPRIAIMSK